ncbi:MAG: FkbM family methyltransferase [Alphaproteobacteria bacterium]|nr:FkbM family methyltransferase [Alphaproteobacteria bacterium]
MKRFSIMSVLANTLLKIGIYGTAHKIRFYIWEPIFQIKRQLFGQETSIISFCGVSIAFPLENSYSKWWFGKNKDNFNAWHEPSITGFILHAKQHHKTMVDIGAHLGYFSAIHAISSGNTAHAIELSPSNFDILEKTLPYCVGVQGDVEIYKLGISNISTSISVTTDHRPRPGINIQSISAPSDGSHQQAIISIETFDQFCTTRNIEPDILKIDVEGSEYDFFTGAKDTLNVNPPIIVMEVHPDKMMSISGKSVEELFELGRSHGYEIYQFLDHRDSKPSTLNALKINSSWPENFDVVFISKSDMSSIDEYNGWCESVRTL